MTVRGSSAVSAFLLIFQTELLILLLIQLLCSVKSDLRFYLFAGLSEADAGMEAGF